MEMSTLLTSKYARRSGAPLIALSLALAGCSGSGNVTGGNPGTVVSVSKGVLQLSVGTANIFGDQPASSSVGLNVVETYRQSAGEQKTGDTNALVDTPTLSGPFVLPATAGSPDGFGATIESGPGPSDAGGSVMNSTAQPDPGAPTINASTFGVSTNASGLGLEPFNFTSVDGNNGGVPDSYVPYVQPLFDPAFNPAGGDTDINSFTPWGGPPGFDPNGDALGVRDGDPTPDGVDGVSLGLDVFSGVAPAAGTYTLAVNVPTSSGPGTTATASSTLAHTALLPAIAPPTVSLDGTGGGTFTVKLPAGVTGALIQIEDIGPAAPADGGFLVGCNSANLVPVYYTLVATASGSYTLPDSIGPGTPSAPGVTLCSPAQNLATSTANGSSETSSPGDTFIIQTIGFDYPAYQADYPQSNGNAAPALAGPNGQSDITISSASGCTVSGGSAAGCASLLTEGDVVKRAHALRKAGGKQLHIPVTTLRRV
jgi:hypothetical protein